ncbi:DUF418 domain-containing protein [Sphingomonas bacterium]|uniref:DUF418 domain-containing protein n=1 Tax=Sphingomonas bacterium TaxID=1895847 RepID=UPI001576E1B3|nr:DUF418 domain-containing protein [Sphingomonas bacterium]
MDDAKGTAAGVAVITSAAEPDGAPRLAGLDILRGIAILCILFMNINDMGASFANFGMAVRNLGWTPADRAAWFLREVLADGTARCLLEMLFGVGMVILTDRAAGALGQAAVRPSGRLARTVRWLFGPWAVMRAYYWRNFVLFMFGVAHLSLLMWPGDILHTYGVAAMVAFLFRRLGPKTLLGFGLILAVVQLGAAGFFLQRAQTSIARIADIRAGHHAPASAADRKMIAALNRTLHARALGRAQQARRIAADDRDQSAATGSAARWFAAAWRNDAFFYLGIGEGASIIEWGSIWEAAGTMLIGAALFRWGVIQGRRSRRFYLVLLLASYAIGLGGRTGRALEEMRFVDYPSLWYATTELTRVATTLGHICLAWLLLGTAAGARLLRPFAAAGRTALSLYVGQTLICLWLLFPPFALGLYGKLGWMSLMLTAAAINLALLALANWWVERFSIAPVEWAWRSIVAGRRLPFRHRHPHSVGAPRLA